MNRDTTLSPKIHYHIRWLVSGEVDWERHDTRTQAEEAAERLSQPGERHSIERFDECCVKCTSFVGDARLPRRR